MSVSLTNSNREFGVDSEDLIYKVSTTDTITSDYKFVVEVYVNSSAFGKYYLSPNPSNVAFFNLSGVCRDLCSVDTATQAGGNIHDEIVVFSKSTTNVKYIEIRAGKYVSATETLNIDSETIYLTDGYRKYSDGLWSSFANLVSDGVTKQVWLTERSRGVKGVIEYESNESEYGVVGFLNDQTFGSQAVKIVYTLYNGSTVIGTHTFAFTHTNAQLPSASATAGKMLYFGVYPLNIVDALDDASVTGIDPLQSANTWTHYRLQLASATADVSLALQVNYVNYNCKHTPVQLAWANQYGSWDYIMFDGRRQSSVDTTSKSYWTETGTWSGTTYTRNTFDSQRKVFGVMATESYDLRAYIQSSNAYNLMPSLYKSDKVMAYIDGTWYPVHVSGNSHQFDGEPISKMQEITVKVTLANPVLC